MAAVLIPCTRPGGWSAGNVFYQGAFSAARESNTTEAISQSRTRAAGTLSNLWFRMTANTCSAASTFKSRINGANGSISISVNASTTGTFQDSSNSDAIAATDLVDFDFTAGAGTGAFTIQGYAFLFAASTNTVFLGGDIGGNHASASTTLYLGLIGGSGTNTTEVNVTQEVPCAGTLKNLYSYVSSNGRSTGSTVRSRVNAADGAMSMSIGASATGIFEDTANSDTLNVGDEINSSVTTGTGTGTLVVDHTNAKFETTTGQFPIGSAQIGTVADGVTRYLGLGAGNNQETTTESNVSVKALFAMTLSRLWTQVNSNSTTTAATFDLRKNQASTALSLSITAGTTGEFSDTTNSVSILSTDELNARIVNGTGGTLFLSWTALASTGWGPLLGGERNRLAVAA